MNNWNDHYFGFMALWGKFKFTKESKKSGTYTFMASWHNFINTKANKDQNSLEKGREALRLERVGLLEDNFVLKTTRSKK